MLASGSDDGTFSIHDFRLLKVCLLTFGRVVLGLIKKEI